MKKLFLTLSLLVFPLTAHAQTPPKQVPEATMQAAIKEFAYPWCKTGYVGLVNSVRNCFLNTDKESPDMDKCILGHIALNLITNDFRKIDESKGDADVTASIEFVSPFATTFRITNAAKAQQYKKTGISYLKKDGVKLYDIMASDTLKCP